MNLEVWKIFLCKTWKDFSENKYFYVLLKKSENEFWVKDINADLSSLPWNWNTFINVNDIKIEKEIKREDILKEKWIKNKLGATSFLSDITTEWIWKN